MGKITSRATVRQAFLAVVPILPLFLMACGQAAAPGLGRW